MYVVTLLMDTTRAVIVSQGFVRRWLIGRAIRDLIGEARTSCMGRKINLNVACMTRKSPRFL